MSYEPVEHDIWEHERFQELSPQGKLLYLWAWTHPQGRMAGLFVASVSTAAHYTGLPADEVRQLLASRPLADFLRFYERGNVWWCCYKPKRARGVKQICGVLSSLAACDQVRRDFATLYGFDPAQSGPERHELKTIDSLSIGYTSPTEAPSNPIDTTVNVNLNHNQNNSSARAAADENVSEQQPQQTVDPADSADEVVAVLMAAYQPPEPAATALRLGKVGRNGSAVSCTRPLLEAALAECRSRQKVAPRHWPYFVTVCQTLSREGLEGRTTRAGPRRTVDLVAEARRKRQARRAGRNGQTGLVATQDGRSEN